MMDLGLGKQTGVTLRFTIHLSIVFLPRFWYRGPKTLGISKVIRVIRVSFDVFNKPLSNTPEFILVNAMTFGKPVRIWSSCLGNLQSCNLAPPPSRRRVGLEIELYCQWPMI